jgi:hypothetical protein
MQESDCQDYRVLHKFEEKSDLGQPRSDLGWTLKRSVDLRSDQV